MHPFSPRADATIASAFSWLEEMRTRFIPPIVPFRREYVSKYQFANPVTRFPEADCELLRLMAGNSDWQERGGRAAGPQWEVREGWKSQDELNEAGMGRTVWVGKPDWARGWNMATSEIQAAVEKAIAGERLGKRQAALIEVMLAEIAETRAVPIQAPECPF